jgi:hypothetical protein
MACLGCGATRQRDVAFFLDDDAPEVTDDALIARARAGPDWLCAFCGDANAPARDHCRNCGAEKGASPSRRVYIEPGGAGGAPPRPPARSGEVNPPSRAASDSGPPTGPAASNFRPWAMAVLLVLVAFVVAAAYFGLRRTEETLTVAGFEWERRVAVEAWRTVREQAWEGSVPAGARVVSRRQEVHHRERDQVGTRRVKAGHRDLGNGFFEDVYRDEPVYRERPVYRTRVTYDVQRWVPDRTVRAAGRDHAARWPDPQLRGGEREASRAETLVVLLNGKRTYRMELPEGRWTALEPGQAVSAVIRGGRSVLELER